MKTTLLTVAATIFLIISGISPATAQATPVGSQTRVVPDESFLLHPEMGGDGPDLRLRDPYETGPPAAGCATLAEIGRHGGIGKRQSGIE